MSDNRRRNGFSPLAIWAFSIGTGIGWGSFIVTCNTYLQKSGVLGTVFGMLVGMAVILVITWNLQYMIRVAPDAGGIYTFEKRIAGHDHGFLAMWFVLLTYLAILWANITSVPLFARFFLGDLFRFGFHYRIFGYEVWLGEALLSIAAVALIGVLCASSARLPNRIMVISALAFAIGFGVCGLIAVLRHDGAMSYAPLYTEGSTPFAQIVRIAAISPWAFIGFENVSHFSEEYAFPVKRIRGILIWSVVITTVLYLFVSLLSVSAYPPEYASWLEYIQDMGSLEGIKAVPAFYAADHYLGQAGVAVLMVSLLGVILTSLIGNMLALSRLLLAAGREGEAPRALSVLNSRGIPGRAVCAVVAISAFIPFLGRTAIGWIVDVTTLGATIIYGMISHAVYLRAGRDNHRLERHTGRLGMVLMVCFLVLLLVPGLLPFDAMETESYVLFIVWSVLGLAYFRKLIRNDQQRVYGKSVLVWIILLVLVLFASTMWVSRATQNATNAAVERIHQYELSKPEDDVERRFYLREEARRICGTNTLYSIVSLGLFLLSTTIILNNFQETRKLDERLSRAEEAARAARRIAELKDSIAALLDNMPGLTFAKDAKTGVYVACNQAFAEYAHKSHPNDVVGLTDDQIFDPVTARHFAEDDRMALDMDEPYIFFEDVLDGAGNRRQFQTTKLKYIDAAGRLCTLGMCQDVTDMVRVQRENATTKEAYEKARSMGLIYTHIAQTLARSYTDLFYVNLETDEFIEYRPADTAKALSEERRGERFFEKYKVEADMYVYPEDRAAFVKALDRKNLLDALNRDGSFMMTYRLLGEDGPIYVSMKVSRMDDDERFIIIAVSDIDAQTRQNILDAKVREERNAYARINALAGNYLCVYVVEPEDGHYREYSAAQGLERLSLPPQGDDFFAALREAGKRIVYREDVQRFLSMFTREGVMSEIERGGMFSMTCRLMIDGAPMYVHLRAAMVEENAGRRMIFGINDIDAYARREEDYARRLAQAQSRATIDALTGVKNRHAFLEAEARLNGQIAEGVAPQFAVTVLDVNDLKRVNDTAGHQAGDQLLRDACRVVCVTFDHSPVFRIGGDEFAVISRGGDYERIDALVETIRAHNAGAQRDGGVVIACGMAKFAGDDASVNAVFERADRNMYEDKISLKAAKAGD